jgi:uncharacterized protein YacL
METLLENRKIEIETTTLKNLNTTRKWTMFLSVTGFIFLGFFIIMGLIAGTFLSAFNIGETGFTVHESLIFILLLILIALCFFPLLFLFRFSKHVALAITNHDTSEISKAFKNLKYYFVYISFFSNLWNGLEDQLYTRIMNGHWS